MKILIINLWLFSIYKFKGSEKLNAISDQLNNLKIKKWTKFNIIFIFKAFEYYNIINKTNSKKKFRIFWIFENKKEKNIASKNKVFSWSMYLFE